MTAAMVRLVARQVLGREVEGPPIVAVVLREERNSMSISRVAREESRDPKTHLNDQKLLLPMLERFEVVQRLVLRDDEPGTGDQERRLPILLGHELDGLELNARRQPERPVEMVQPALRLGPLNLDLRLPLLSDEEVDARPHRVQHLVHGGRVFRAQEEALEPGWVDAVVARELPDGSLGPVGEGKRLE